MREDWYVSARFLRLDEKNSNRSHPFVRIDPRYAEYIENNTDYYIPVFERLCGGEKKISWNWTSFWVPLVWMTFRRMYWQALVVEVCSFLFNLIVVLAFFYQPLAIALPILVVRLALQSVFSMFADYLYYRRIQSLLKDADDQSQRSDARHFRRHSRAGVDYIAAGISVMYLFTLPMLLVYTASMLF